MKRALYGVAFFLFLCAPLAVPNCFASAGPAAQTFGILPHPGERIPLQGGGYFTYGFARHPQLGTCVMTVEIFTRDGRRDTSYGVKGDADMPSMRGVHSTGDHPFVLNAKGVYLLPVRLVMPGDWEVRFTFVKNGATVLRGAYRFDL